MQKLNGFQFVKKITIEVDTIKPKYQINGIMVPLRKF